MLNLPEKVDRPEFGYSYRSTFKPWHRCNSGSWAKILLIVFAAFVQYYLKMTSNAEKPKQRVILKMYELICKYHCRCKFKYI